ncbi:hypothetical protein BB561_003258 [Smittium simulii]|uniref:Uncharacterized protein n=1 Tax=Smittium simulii TaxID=133385 RepID=A0A2T9YMD0_9FUNG|nr:hypothetical protein BB561_003258 [Smittium simulii]
MLQQFARQFQSFSSLSLLTRLPLNVLPKTSSLAQQQTLQRFSPLFSNFEGLQVRNKSKRVNKTAMLKSLLKFARQFQSFSSLSLLTRLPLNVLPKTSSLAQQQTLQRFSPLFSNFEGLQVRNKSKRVNKTAMLKSLLKAKQKRLRRTRPDKPPQKDFNLRISKL